MAAQKLFTAAPETPAELQARFKARVTLGDEAMSKGLYDEAKRHYAIGEAYLTQAHRIIQAERVAA